MKKSISLLCTALMCTFSLNAKTVYLVPNSNWKQADAKFSANYFGGEGITQSFTDFMTTTDGIHYETTVPDAAQTIIFVRHNPAATTPDWDSKWNQTSDLAVSADNNCYTIADGAWDKGEGTWSTYTPSVEGPTYYITGNENLVGQGNEWNTKAIELGKASADKPATYTFKNLAAKDTMRLKVTNGTWDLSFGYKALNNTCSSENIMTDKDNNIVFVLTAQGDVTLTFDGTKICLTGSFVAPVPVQNITAYYVNTNNWEKVYAYVYNNNGGLKAQWPGEEMTKTADQKNGFDVYSYEFAEIYTTIVFNNGYGGVGYQTANLIIDKTKLYFYGDTWYATLDEIPIPCTPDFGVMVGTDYTAAVTNPENAAEYMILALDLKKGNTFTMYNNCEKAAWVIENIKESSTENITIDTENKNYVVGADGKYDIYFTLDMTNGDAIYFGYTAPTPTEIVNADFPATDAPLYNLLGVQVDNTYRGIVIQSGHKFLLQ